MKYIVTVRGRLKDSDPQVAQQAHDAVVARLGPLGQHLGSMAHQPFVQPDDPQEFLAMDMWSSLEGIQKFMALPENPGGAIASLFSSPPEVTVWAEAGWSAFMQS